ncbi:MULTISPECIES: WbqC family protein [Dyadobacter]|uniref:WbqC family protein n=1 Tax=Dyadobacter chenhuakuii TaxID=2909339 RepID=A0A9X1QBG0_9BACT|nr:MULTISPECIES: WbqC family protein [Dyadobacter]MCF2497357.1 WbqC family protein [Dyadobacter chenhuakuii]MCF2516854.1 WbqC family protein [Dyadobacter sp. CY351]
MSEIESNSKEISGIRIELQYLPCIAYFTSLLKYDRIYIDIEERYVKQTYRNRCSVLTANKVDQLTVPVQKYETAAPTKDIKIDYGQDWLRRHLGCLQSAYGKSPFYEFYAPELLQIYDKKLAYLVDLNYELLTICLRLVGVKKDLQYNLSGLEMEESSVFNAISLINNKKSDFSPEYYKPEPYYQTFGNDFVSNLSIIDLLFNMGPEARSVLLRSCKFQ